MAELGVLPGLKANTWQMYEPALFCAANGAVTHPTVPSVRQGRYIRLADGLIMAQFKLVAGSSGVSAGSGSCFVVSLPVPARRAFDTQIIGQGFPYRAVTGASYQWACVATLADAWTSLNGEHDGYCQFYTPWTTDILTFGFIAGNASSVTIPHDLGYAPDASDITVNLTQAPGGPGANSRWPLQITGITSAQYTVSRLDGATMTTSNQDIRHMIRAHPQSGVVGSDLIGPKYARTWNALSSVLFQVYYEPA